MLSRGKMLCLPSQRRCRSLQELAVSGKQTCTVPANTAPQALYLQGLSCRVGHCNIPSHLSAGSAIDGPDFGTASAAGGDKESAEQRLRRLLGDVFYHSAQATPGSVPPPPTPQLYWATFAELMSAQVSSPGTCASQRCLSYSAGEAYVTRCVLQGVTLTPSDWADLKPFTVVMHRKVHVLWTPLAGVLGE
jgi:hypothetical protein